MSLSDQAHFYNETLETSSHHYFYSNLQVYSITEVQSVNKNTFRSLFLHPTIKIRSIE